MHTDASDDLLDAQIAAVATAVTEPVDDLYDDGACLFYREQPDPDLVWKAAAYEKNSLQVVRHESDMSDGAGVLLDLLRRCSGQLDRYDYRAAMQAHLDLVYPRAIFENDCDCIVREVEAKRAHRLTVIEGGR